MQLSFKQKYFKKDQFYRLEAVRAIKKDFLFSYLTVSFFPLDNGESLRNLQRLALEKSYSKYFGCLGGNQYNRSIILTVEVALLPLLLPGSIWEASSSDSIKMVFNPKSAKSITIGEKRVNMTYGDAKNKLGQNNGFKFLKNDRNLNLLSVSDSTFEDKKTTVLIPHSEIVRCYFAASRYFINKLFTEDPIADNASLIGDIEENKNLCKIKLNSRHYPDSDAPFLAQALLNSKNMHAMRMIYSYAYGLVNYEKNSDHERNLFELPLKTTLPFSDKTKLDVIGYFVSDKKSEERVFLIRKIVTSHHIWEFEKLQIISAETFPNQPRSGFASNIRYQTTEVNQDDANLIISDNPHANNPELDILLEDNERFPFLETVEIQKVVQNRSEQEHECENLDAGKPIVKKETVLNKGSLGKRSYQQNNTTNPAHFTHPHNQEKVKGFSDIAKIFYEIEKSHDGWAITALPTSKINQSVPYGEFQFSCSSWSIIQGRYRRALLLKIKITNRNPVYCLEIESDHKRKYGIYFFSNIKPDISLSPLELMETIDKQKGNRIKKLLSTNFNDIKRLNHTNVGNSLHERMIKVIDDIF